MTDSNSLGTYLRDRRAKLDPSAFGLPLKRRRTPGLRREGVAQRANVSATWYTWLEQGRGGAPSANVLDRIARAMMMTDVEGSTALVHQLGDRYRGLLNGLREVLVGPGRLYFDTNIGAHHHFYIEDDGTLLDIPADKVSIAHLPAAPDGMSVERVDVVVRVRR